MFALNANVTNLASIILLSKGDELILSKFSNAVRSVRELSILLEICRIKQVCVISIRDKIDSEGELFPETKVCDALYDIIAYHPIFCRVLP